LKKILVIVTSVLIIQGCDQLSHTDDEFYGVVESRPDGKAGTWVVGGRSVSVTDNTDFDEDNGPLNVGTCAEVELENEIVEEIESEPDRKCAK
jgi:hypothetical protein